MLMQALEKWFGPIKAMCQFLGEANFLPIKKKVLIGEDYMNNLSSTTGFISHASLYL